MSIFLDASVLYSAYNEDDEAAVGIYLLAFSGRWGPVYTSDYVLDETVTLLKAKATPALALKFLKSARTSKWGIVKIDEAVFDAACGIFERYYDRPGLSFTDATTLAVLNALDIDHLASFDGRSFDGIAGSRISENYWAQLGEDEKKKILRSRT